MYRLELYFHAVFIFSSKYPSAIYRTGNVESASNLPKASHVEGRCSEAKYQECLGAAACAVDKIFDFYRECVRRKFSKEFSCLGGSSTVKAASPSLQ